MSRVVSETYVQVIPVSRGPFGRLILDALKEFEEKSGVQLSIPQRLLLAEVGSLEQVLSILAGSPIEVEVVRQEKALPKSPTVVREVYLLNEKKERLVHAVTHYRPNDLPLVVARDLEEGMMGIGSVLTLHGIETRREIRKMGYDPKKDILFRDYQILSGNSVYFKIREEFPRLLFSESKVT